jgi:transcriptional regulator NrdR family protein
MPTKVKKRDGTFEDFMEAKIVAGVRRAGATAEEAARVAKEVAQKLAGKMQITAEELSDMIVAALAKVNKAASAAFMKFRDTKLKAKKKK